MSARLDTKNPPRSKSSIALPFVFAKQHGVLIDSIQDNTAKVLFTARLKAEILGEVRRFVGMPLQCQEVEPQLFEKLLTRKYQGSNEQTQQLVEDLDENMDLVSLADSFEEAGDLLEQEDNAPIIRFINALLTQAIREKASDIHIESFKKNLIVRFRIDGVLQEIARLRPDLAPLIVSRMKVMAKLDIAEKRLPQDGRISILIGGREIDIRISTIPANNGERVVMRLLDKSAHLLDLGQLGMTPKARKTMGEIIAMPHGIVLVTGPTGAGKTTTLYAALGALDKESRNIMTIEDPIEYQLENVGQTQVKARIGMTFAAGLRAILRQDPDVVMVGEIRDLETAEIAVQASLTGHLVFSTLHTNTAIGAIIRLRDMGIEPFLLSSSLAGLIAQRLVRKLCTRCKEPYSPTQADHEALGTEGINIPKAYKATGCNHCRHTGYDGRLGIYEVIKIDETLQTLIHSQASEQELTNYVRKDSPSILSDGIQKVIEGTTTIQEILRVTQKG